MNSLANLTVFTLKKGYARNVCDVSQFDTFAYFYAISNFYNPTSFPGSFPQTREKTLGTRLFIILICIVWCHFLEISMISVAGVKLHRIWRPEISDETQLLIRSSQKQRNQLPPLTSQVHLPQISCCAAVDQNITTSNIRSFARIWWI